VSDKRPQQETESIDVFISHACEDKESVARPLCRLLRSLGLLVWLDENELDFGDRLGNEISDALTRCRYGLVILSPAFVSKEWPVRELNALIARERNDYKVILPVWHGVTKEMVARLTPDLLDRKYATTDGGLEQIAEAVLKLYQQDAVRYVSNERRVIKEVPGEWHLKKAELHILRTLRKREKEVRDPFYSGNRLPWQRLRMRNDLLRDYYVRYRKREMMVVVTASTDQGVDCHACAPRLSLFEFSKIRFGWGLDQCFPAVTRWGQWGSVGKDQVSVRCLGDDNYGLFLEQTEMHQGILSAATSIQARIGDRYQEVLPLQTSEMDGGTLTPGANDWQSIIKILPGTNAFYDLLVQRRGTRESRQFEETELFRFNGRTYVSSELFL
jgi:TIR domain